jgi:hypothetical protein
MASFVRTAAVAVVFGLSALSTADAASAFKPTNFGVGVWRSVTATTRNPVTGVSSSDLQRLTFGTNGRYTDVIVVEGGNGLSPGHTGVGGIIEITGTYKVLSATSLRIAETSETLCALYCEPYPTSAIGKTFTETVTKDSPGVVTGMGGLKWTEIAR